MRPELPPALGEKADPDKLHAFFEHVFNHDTPSRIRLRSTLNRARLYYIAKQWNQPIDRGDPDRSPDWEQLRSTLTGIPMPTQNEMFPIITREAALLTKVGSKPYVRPDTDDPRAEDAAKIAKDVLMYRHEETGWADHDRRGAFSDALYGTWFEVSYWDVDHTKTTRVPITTAVKCPQCDFRLAKPQLQEAEALPILNQRPEALEVSEVPSTNPNVEPARRFRAVSCPQCDTHEEPSQVPALDPETQEPMLDEMGAPTTVESMVSMPGAPALEEYVPTQEEAKDQEDAVGRPLGEDVPLGDTALEIVRAYGAFPEPSKQGVETEPETWEEFGWEVPRSLEWIRSRYPKNGDQVQAERSSQIFEHHPIVGGLGALAGGPGPTIFENHALCRYFAKKPWLEKKDGTHKRNLGRLVIMAGRVVLFDGDLLRESQENPGQHVPLYHFDWSVWELRDLEAHGLGMAELGFSQQDAINTQESQVMDARHRWLNPKLQYEDGVEVTFQGGAGSSYASDVLIYKRNNPDTQVPPTVLQGTVANPGIWGEYDRHVEGLQRTLMQREVESGAPPKDVTAFSALELLARKAAEGRTPRVERIRDMKKRRYKHQLQLMHEFYREKRYYHVRGKNDKWAVKSFMGTDLMGQCTVLLEDEPVIDASIASREGITLGLNIGTVVPDTAAAKRKINGYLKIPLDVNEDANNQVDAAEAESLKWVDQDIEPVIDEDGDANTIHWEVHKLDLGRQEWVERKEECRWGEARLATWGWKEDLTRIETAEQQFKLQPPTPPVRVAGPFGTGDEAYAGAQKLFEAQQQVLQEIQALPRPTELRIMAIWKRMLTAAGFEPTPDEAWAFGKVFRMEAHAAGHRWIAQKQTLAATAGMPQPSAPGGEQNPAGMIPGQGEAVTAPPGGGGDGLPMPGAA